jgi:hypothetical protein
MRHTKALRKIYNLSLESWRISLGKGNKRPVIR